MLVRQTPLGRWLKHPSDAEYEKDAILAILYTHHLDSANPADLPLTQKGLSIATGWSERKVADRLGVLVNKGLVVEVGDQAYRISPEGVEFADKAKECSALDVE